MQELTWKNNRGYFQKRNRNSHKGTFGTLLCITGSNRMPGACALSTLAALRSGAGLVKVATTERNLPILASQIYEAVYLPMQTTETGEICWEKNASVLQLALKQASAVLIGCGLGNTVATQELLRNVVNLVECPLILDADGLNALASCIDIMQKQKPNWILTPHPGEMSRLTKKPVSEILTTLEQSAETFAKRFHVICVLKDFHTVTAVSDGMTYVNLSGNNGMATAGSGDVLAGVIGSLLAQGMKAEEAAPLGVYVHGLAGDAAKEKCGVRGMMASDIIEGLKEVEKS